jgi:DNA-directed RNA polymerase specialized sigma24 family protein
MPGTADFGLPNPPELPGTIPAKPIPEARSGGSAKSMPFDDNRFIDSWPAVDRRIHQLLRRRGCVGADCDDIAQEVALRLFARRVPFSDAAELGNYALKTARNLHVTLLRESHPTVGIEVAELVPGLARVETTVEQRLALEAAHSEMRKLSRPDLQLLNDPPAQDRQAAQKQKVPRHRLRRRIERATGGLLILAAAVTSGGLTRHLAAPHPIARQSTTRPLMLRVTNTLIGRV